MSTHEDLVAEVERLRKVLADLMPFVMEDYWGDCATPDFKAAVEAAKAALEEKR